MSDKDDDDKGEGYSKAIRGLSYRMIEGDAAHRSLGLWPLEADEERAAAYARGVRDGERRAHEVSLLLAALQVAHHQAVLDESEKRYKEAVGRESRKAWARIVGRDSRALAAVIALRDELRELWRGKMPQALKGPQAREALRRLREEG